MSRGRALTMLLSGGILLSLALALVFGDFVEHDLSEALGFLPLLLGLFLVAEGLIGLWRRARLPPSTP